MLNKRFSTLIFFFSAAFCIQSFMPALAAYDVYTAKTIGSENVAENETVTEETIPTYNDPELPNFSEDESIVNKIGKKTSEIVRKKRNKNKAEDEIESEPVEENVQSVKSVPSEVENIEDKNKFNINADRITYDELDGNVYAHGNVQIVAPVQQVTLKSDDAVLDKESQTLKLTNNVKIIKDGSEISGEYMLINLNEQNILMDDPVLHAYQFVVKAQEAFLIENDVQMLNGTLTSEGNVDFTLETRGFQTYENVSLDYIRQKNLDRKIESDRKQVYDVKSKEIVITSYKDHNSVLLKKANVFYNKHKVIANSDIEIISDKQNNVTETNAPEAGNFRNFGMYAGYGFVFKLPKGQTLKFMPVLTYGDHNLGVGALMRHRSKNGMVEAGYNTSTTNLVVNGRYNFGHGLALRYGRNAYMPEGFLGARKSGYAAQLQFQKSFIVKDLDISFNNAVYAGIFSDYVKHKQERHAYATSRFRYMAEIRKDWFKYKNKEQDFGLRVSSVMQGAATVYGSGQTTGIVRIGPYLTTNLRKWVSSIGYLISGVHGDSPFWFDKYMYGKSSVMINEKFNFNNKFAMGYRATITPKKDNYKEDLLTESRLYAILGPQDLKLCLSYDFVRDIAHIDLMFLLGTNSSKIYFDKLITKNMDANSNKKDFYKSKPVKIVVPENI